MGENEDGNDLDQWNISAPQHPNGTQQPPEESENPDGLKAKSRALDEELSGWGVEIPPIIEDGADAQENTEDVEMPSIIASSEETAEIPNLIASSEETEGTPDDDGSEDRTEQFELPTKTNINTNILSQIDQEEKSDFWSADQGTPTPETNPSTGMGAIDEGEVVQRIRDALTPIIEDIVKRYCQKNIEKVAWEVIPDLAENLIKKEIKNIADSTDK